MISIALGQMRRRAAAFVGLAVALLLAVATVTLFGSLFAADIAAPAAARKDGRHRPAASPDVLRWCGPFVADQPFWAARTHAAGVASEPQPQRRLTAEELTAAITLAAGDADMAHRGRSLGDRVRAEDGARRAVGIL
ncbi:hypothetical protein HTZ77_33430 [Nonomuraea sp. SMC257]|uniref:Uncharacterized protein n=1 Tax=Nonomuraea montanisoli TaxID=2741721 RepID=A0A7Y6M731_9ACTN|nr:hypothetical protein [Nonomuraea montanisoli]NUW36275.1 hypothetical protein [Nonomuraea montanisoli]